MTTVFWILCLEVFYFPHVKKTGEETRADKWKKTNQKKTPTTKNEIAVALNYEYHKKLLVKSSLQ